MGESASKMTIRRKYLANIPKVNFKDCQRNFMLPKGPNRTLSKATSRPKLGNKKQEECHENVWRQTKYLFEKGEWRKRMWIEKGVSFSGVAGIV